MENKLEVKEDLKESEKTKIDKKKTLKILRIIGDVFLWVAIFIIGSMYVVQEIDKSNGYKTSYLGYRNSVITSESMAYANGENTYLTEDMHRIDKFDVILTKDYRSYEEIQLYDVLTYYSPENGLICHRVIKLYEQDGQKYIITRGDSNAVDDSPITFSDVRGKVINVTPKAGHFVRFIQSPYFLVAFCFSAFFIFLGVYIYDRDKDKKLAKSVTETKEDTKDIQEQGKDNE